MRATRAVAFLALLLLVGCIRTQNTYEVHAPGAVSAEVRFCDRTIQLRRSGERFVAAHKNTCGDDGPAVTVRFADRPPVSCPEVYTTTGMVQRFEFEVAHGQCNLSNMRVSNPYPS